MKWRRIYSENIYLKYWYTVNFDKSIFNIPPYYLCMAARFFWKIWYKILAYSNWPVKIINARHYFKNIELIYIEIRYSEEN
jgi:hypothetical protein